MDEGEDYEIVSYDGTYHNLFDAERETDTTGASQDPVIRDYQAKLAEAYNERYQLKKSIVNLKAQVAISEDANKILRQKLNSSKLKPGWYYRLIPAAAPLTAAVWTPYHIQWIFMAAIFAGVVLMSAVRGPRDCGKVNS